MHFTLAVLISCRKSEGACLVKVLISMGETFFASRFGHVRDRFDMNWKILHERPILRAAVPSSQGTV